MFRSHETPEFRSQQTYDPYKLVDQVQALLREQGLQPEIPSGEYSLALAGAGQMLRGMGIQPAMAFEDAVNLDRDFMKDATD